MMTLKSYVGGRFVEGRGEAHTLVNPATEEPLARAGSEGVDRGAALDFARTVGGPALRALTFAQRGLQLKALCDLMQARREELIEIAVRNGGNTRADAKFDIDGATFTLATYAEIGQELGERHLLVDGEGVTLGRSPRFHGRHVLLPRHGVALHVNAFNFPAWGLAEKAAAALLAGVPVLAKPATSSAMLAHRIVELAVEEALFPEGALSLLVGAAGDLLEHVGPQDVVAFTGSGATGAVIRGLKSVIHHSVRVNVEADSLNAAVLGPDVKPDSETYTLYVKDVLRDMTQKAGQKCTAIRRVLVPEGLAERVRDDLIDRLEGLVVGNPVDPTVRMGPLASREQQQDVRQGTDELAGDGRLVFGSAGLKLVGVEPEQGFFVGPVLIEVEPGADAPAVHSREVFGPVATIVPYSGGASAAAEIVARGEGGLVCSVYSDDTAFVSDMVMAVGPYHGRLFLGSSRIAEHAPGPGTVLPLTVHGGPGRAGGGEELGGVRALSFYMQRVALQGARPVIDRIAGTQTR